MPSANRGVAWCFTLNNYTDEECSALVAKDVRGLCAYRELGESGTPHLQGVVCCHAKATLTQMKKILGSRAHIELMRGTWEEACTYCRKDGDKLVDRSEGPKPGSREDITKLLSMASDLTTTEETAWDELPGTMARAMRAYDRRRDLSLLKLKRTVMPEVFWIWGETGSGKSHLVFQDLDMSDVHVQEVADNGWWDSYRGQGTLILNEFRGEIAYPEMLSLLDKWPKKVKRRGREPMPFVATTIYITSSSPPEHIYCRQNMKYDGINQLMRRMKVIEKRRDDGLTRDGLAESSA